MGKSVSYKIIRLPTVIQRTGLSKGSIYGLRKSGKFPKPIMLGPNSVGWIENEVNDWIACKMSDRDYQPSLEFSYDEDEDLECQAYLVVKN